MKNLKNVPVFHQSLRIHWILVFTFALTTTTILVQFIESSVRHAIKETAKESIARVDDWIRKVILPNAYQIWIETDLEKSFDYNGTVIVSFTVSEPVQRIAFHASGLDILSVSILRDENKRPFSALQDHVACHEEEQYCMVPAIAVLFPDIEYTLEIQFQGRIREHALNGFYISHSGSSEKSSTTKKIASTHFEPTAARMAFPCFDDPSLKATFQLSIGTHPSFHVVSNTPIQETTDHEWMRFFHFEQTPKMSTYLVAWVISDLVSINTNSSSLAKSRESNQSRTTKISVYHRPNQKFIAEYVLSSATHAFNCYENLFGYPYPLAKMDLVPVEIFGGEAMENFGLLIFEEQLLMLDLRHANSEDLERMHLLVAHEIAHQWFGDLVTMSRWKDLFLNEGFAEFFQYHCTMEPHDINALEEKFFSDELLVAFDADVIPSRGRPLWRSTQSESESDFSVYFDDITYNKGAVVLRMLQVWINLLHLQETGNLRNAETLSLGLHAFLLHHEYESVSIKDWLNDMDTLFLKNSNNHMNLLVSEFLGSWLEYPGYPILTIHRPSENIKRKTHQCSLIIKQDPYALNILYHPNITWSIPLLYQIIRKQNITENSDIIYDTINTNQDKDTMIQFNMLTSKNQTIRIPVENGTDCESFMVSMNIGNIGYFRVKYSIQDTFLMAQWIHDHSSNHSNKKSNVLGVVPTNDFKRAFLSDLLYLFITGYYNDDENMDVLVNKSMSTQSTDKSWVAGDWLLKVVELVMSQERNVGIWKTFQQNWILLYEYICSPSKNTDTNKNCQIFEQFSRKLIASQGTHLRWMTFEKIGEPQSHLKVNIQDPDASLRYEIAGFCLIFYCEENLIKQGKDLFEKLLSRQLRVEMKTKDINLILQLGVRYVKDGFDRLYRIYFDGNSDLFNGKKPVDLLLNALCYAQTKENQLKVLNLLKNSQHLPMQTVLSALTIMNQSSMISYRLIWTFFQKEHQSNAKWTQEIGKAKLNKLIEMVVSKMNTEEELEWVENCIREKSMKRIQMGLERGLIRLQSKIRFPHVRFSLQ